MSAKISMKLVRKMYADYGRGLSAEKVGARHGRSGTEVRRLFKREGLARRALAVLEGGSDE